MLLKYIVFYSLRETEYSALGLLRELAAGDRVTDVDNKELMLLTTEHNTDSAREGGKRKQVVTVRPPSRPHDQRPCDRSHTLCAFQREALMESWKSNKHWGRVDKASRKKHFELPLGETRPDAVEALP